MNAFTAASRTSTDMSPAAKAVLLSGSAGFLFANFTAQFLGVQVGAHTGLDVAAAGHAWATAVFTLASFVGAATAQPIEQRFGLRNYFVWGALLLSVFGLLQALVPSQPLQIAMRAFEGFASGTFGPKALLAAFMFCRTGRLPMTMALAGFFLLVVGVIGFVMLCASDSLLGQQGLFLAQFAVGALMVLAGLRWLPRTTQTAAHAPVHASTFPRPHPAASRRRRRAQRHAPSTQRSTAA